MIPAFLAISPSEIAVNDIDISDMAKFGSYKLALRPCKISQPNTKGNTIAVGINRLALSPPIKSAVSVRIQPRSLLSAKIPPANTTKPRAVCSAIEVVKVLN